MKSLPKMGASTFVFSIWMSGAIAQTHDNQSDMLSGYDPEWSRLQADITQERLDMRLLHKQELTRIREQHARDMARLRGDGNREARRRAKERVKQERARLRATYRNERVMLQETMRRARQKRHNRGRDPVWLSPSLAPGAQCLACSGR